MISETGSPRVASSSTPPSACLNPGCASSAFGRPAPGRRDRPRASAASAPGSAACAAPAATVTCDAPDARATAATPPRPSARASVPRYTRHWRSSSSSRITANFAASPASASSAIATYHTLAPKSFTRHTNHN